MSFCSENQHKNCDRIKWAAIICLLFVMIAGHYSYPHAPLLLKTLSTLVITGAAAFLVTCTQKGKGMVEFVQLARFEIQKVTWPMYQESLRLTFVVIVVTVMLALLLWGIDTILVRLITLITALRF